MAEVPACGQPTGWLSLAGLPVLIASAVRAVVSARPRNMRQYLADYFAKPCAGEQDSDDGRCPFGEHCPNAAALERVRELEARLREAEQGATRVSPEHAVQGGGDDSVGGALHLLETVAALRAWGLSQAHQEACSAQLRDLSRVLTDLTQEHGYVRCFDEDGEPCGMWLEYCQVSAEHKLLKSRESELTPLEAKRRRGLWLLLGKFKRERTLLQFGQREERLRQRMGALRGSEADATAAAALMREKFLSLRASAERMVGAAVSNTVQRYGDAYADLADREGGAVGAIAAVAAGINESAPPPPLRQVQPTPSCHQELGYLLGLYRQALQLKREGALEQVLDRVCKGIREQGHGGSVQTCPLKSLERAVQKTMEENAGDYARICDIVRGSVVCGTAAGVLAAMRLIAADPCLRVLRVKNRLHPGFDAEASGGYRDVLINATVGPSQHVVEVQLHVRCLQEVKHEGGGHQLYSVARALHLYNTESRKHYGVCTEEVVARIASGGLREASFGSTAVPVELHEPLARALASPQCALHTLSVDSCDLTSAGFLDVRDDETNSSLCRLDLSGNPGLEELPVGASRLQRVDWSDEWRHCVSDEVAARSARRWRSSGHLDLKHCHRVTDEGLRRVAAELGTTARYVELDGCTRLSDDAVARVCGMACEQLVHVSLRGGKEALRLTDAVLKAVARSCPKLRVCDLGHPQHPSPFGNDGVAALLSGCPELESLDLEFAKEIGDEAFQPLADAPCRRTLRTLKLRGCKRLTDAACDMFGHCSQLQELDLGAKVEHKLLVNPKVEDDGVLTVVRRCPMLRKFMLPTRCTDVAMHALASLRHLEAVSVLRCRHVTTTGVEFLIANSSLSQNAILGAAVLMADKLTQAGMDRCSRLRICTFAATGPTHHEHHLWTCSCRAVDSTLKGHCTACQVVCHRGRGHRTPPQPRWTRCYCDCGANDGSYPAVCLATEASFRERRAAAATFAMWWLRRWRRDGDLDAVVELVGGPSPGAFDRTLEELGIEDFDRTASDAATLPTESSN